MQPNLLNDTTFEVTVENELVCKKMQSLTPQIINYMRTKLHNSKIEMTVRIIEHHETKRAYSRVEQFQMMGQKNPILLKLKETFVLELS